jgi:hypothetical protein
MINVIGRYAKQHHYKIHPMKTKIIQYPTTNDEYKWYLDDRIPPCLAPCKMSKLSLKSSAHLTLLVRPL